MLDASKPDADQPLAFLLSERTNAEAQEAIEAGEQTILWEEVKADLGL
ncbi:hypothetical protein [Arthrobacter sp. B2a2-09]|nr:hypothetical protein [Arthrobacter sp. B2a2-09]MCZ9881451.1 hypothetical protein [Arthrobacter sp. B2a2-09]